MDKALKDLLLLGLLLTALCLVVSHAQAVTNATWTDGVNTVQYFNGTAGTDRFIVPIGVTQVYYIVVGGGGSGGHGTSTGVGSGGGGAGGLRTGWLDVTPGANYIVKIGAGGAAQTTDYAAGNAGTFSSFASINASGGGAGGSYVAVPTNGGSGGGGAGLINNKGTGNIGGYTPSEGSNGGQTGGYAAGCGGGGATGAGSAPGVTTIGGAGGAGYTSTIAGIGTIATGGVGGNYTLDQTNRAAATKDGDGGAGGHAWDGGAGDSGAGANGAVIVVYATPTGSWVRENSSYKYTYGTTTYVVMDTPGIGTWTVPAGVTSVWYTLIGGGGGGGGSPTGSSGAGGGGAGGFLNGTMTVTPGAVVNATVGAGGNGGAAAGDATGFGSNGGYTTFATTTAYYGGGGGGYSNQLGKAGASAGGSSNGQSGRTDPISLTPVQGFHGGAGAGAANYPGGGGGGATTHGSDATGTNGGAGGTGNISAVTGTALYYSGGGGGGADATGGGAGGDGGGGTGATGSTLPTAGVNGLGGGGGGGDSVGNEAGAPGGSGAILLQYATPNNNLSAWVAEGSHYVATIDGDIVYKFTTSETFTIPANMTSVWYTVVAGGGAGGGYTGGGGGAGQVANGTLAVTPEDEVTVTVGAGSTTTGNYILAREATAGANSVFSTVTAVGGSKGGTFNLDNSGGAGYNGGGSSYTGGTTNGSNKDGGAGAGSGGESGGGGAGQGTDGIAGTAARDGGQGGLGVNSTILGIPIYLGGGGGGGTDGGAFTGNGGQAAPGYGGGSGSDDDAGGNAVAGTGGGGGAAGHTAMSGGVGGSGIIYLRYTPDAPPAITPIVLWSANVTSGLQDLAVQFTDASFIDINSWNWTFDNGNTSTEQNPLFTFTTLGDHHVTLNVTNASGYNLSAAQTITVLQRIAPIVNFTTNVSSGYAPLDVGFTDISFTDILTYNWTFGTLPGNYSEEQNPSFSFHEVGPQPITLRVTNASSYNTTTLYITTTNPPGPPLAMYTPSTNKSILWPAGIKLTSTTTGTVTNVSWQWGDNTTTYGTVSSKHVYTFPGTYKVNMTASSAYGATSNYSYIKVVI